MFIFSVAAFLVCCCCILSLQFHCIPLQAEGVPYVPVKAARSQAWRETDQVELRRFLGIWFLSGIIAKPTVAMYWSTNKVLHLFISVCTSHPYHNILHLMRGIIAYQSPPLPSTGTGDAVHQ